MTSKEKPSSCNKQSQDFHLLPSWAKECIQQLIARNQELEARVQELEAQVAKNSSNSGKPPSSDGLKKPPKTKSQRGKSGRKPGGQNGRAGKTLEQVDSPDHIVIHTPLACGGCGHSLKETEGLFTAKRQVFDLPEPKIEVTEHRTEEKICPCCGEISKGVFPENVTAPVRYGERVQALAAYFAHQHFLPFDRLTQIFEDIFGIGISPATCANVDKKLFIQLESFEVKLKAHLIASEVLHFDETGMRCNKKLHWIHVASSEAATFYGIHAKRGKKAIDDFNVLPQFRGYAIHDHWSPYFAYEQVMHGLCNSHHLRELSFVHEHEKENWAKEMKELLLKVKKIVEDHDGQKFLPKERIKALEKDYAAIILDGMKYHLAQSPLTSKKKGRRQATCW